MKLALALLVALATTAAADSQVSNYLYLNRCKGSCTVHGGFDDARAMSSSIPCGGTVTCGNGGCSCNGGTGGDYVIEEFKNAQGQTGAAADAEWNAIVKCVREVYSPYNVTVSDQPPTGGLSHTQGIVAGRPSNINYGSAGIGGIAPGSLACAPQDNVISFSFANIYSGPNRIIDICATAAQETAHSFGLDHAFSFTDGRSACPDPMSYRGDCGSTQRFFRNDNVTCGEFSGRPCRCGGFQNSHLRLLSIFGEGTPLTAPPTLHLDMPADGATIQNGAVVFATASAQRGVFRVELWLNGYKWATAKGAPFGSNGQPTTQYSLMLPPTVPDGVIDIVVKAFDDINAETDTPSIRVTKGAPCTSADSCAKGQQCDSEGRCYWDAPTGLIGDACTYPQFCESGNCLAVSDGQYCSQDCVVGVSDSCPMGFACDGEPGRAGFCVHDSGDGAGCCSIGDDGRSAALLSLLVVGLLLGRRRR